jgi:hypothetical protein
MYLCKKCSCGGQFLVEVFIFSRPLKADSQRASDHSCDIPTVKPFLPVMLLSLSCTHTLAFFRGWSKSIGVVTWCELDKGSLQISTCKNTSNFCSTHDKDGWALMTIVSTAPKSYEIRMLDVLSWLILTFRSYTTMCSDSWKCWTCSVHFRSLSLEALVLSRSWIVAGVRWMFINCYDKHKACPRVIFL